MAKGIIEKDLIFLIAGETGAIERHRRKEQDADSPDRPNDRNHNAPPEWILVPDTGGVREGKRGLESRGALRKGIIFLRL
jgi:hypothetical protein